jgi:hypothetical protein
MSDKVFIVISKKIYNYIGLKNKNLSKHETTLQKIVRHIKNSVLSSEAFTPQISSELFFYVLLYKMKLPSSFSLYYPVKCPKQTIDTKQKNCFTRFIYALNKQTS